MEKTKSKCSKCLQVKPIAYFYRDKKCRRRGGLQYHCKNCIKQSRRAYYDANWEKIIERVRAYKVLHPEVARRHSEKQRQQQTEAEKHAWRALNREVLAGRVIKPERCSKCGSRRKLFAHHHKGYSKQYALDVMWVCVPCHHEIHGRGPNTRKEQL